MFFNNIKHNLIIIICILLTLNGCNNENIKLTIENNNTVDETEEETKEIIEIKEIKETKEIEKIKKPLFNKNNLKKKILNNIISENNNTKPKETNNNNIVFEFRNERLLQGRNISNNIEEEKTKLALSAVQKMFKKNLSSSDTQNVANIRKKEDFKKRIRKICLQL